MFRIPFRPDRRIILAVVVHSVPLLFWIALLSSATFGQSGSERTMPIGPSGIPSGAAPTLTDISRAISLSAGYLERACDQDGKFVYVVDTGSGRESTAYNIIRHAGAMYALAMYQQSAPDRETADVLIRAAKLISSRKTIFLPVSSPISLWFGLNLAGHDLRQNWAQLV
jgi:hypothetical protein